MQTRRQVGTYWKEGLITGIVLDALVAATVLYIAATYRPPGNLVGSFH
jgi:hypothetical protein